MGKTFTQIPLDAFKTMQTEAGVILKTFDPANPSTFDRANIVCATTGNITPSCIPTYRDNGEDVNNCPPNMKELKELVSWDCTLAFTALGVTPETLRLSLGAADVTGNKIAPRHELKDSDFADIWWVGDRSDGGMVAVCLKNALSTAGLSLTTAKNSKGQLAVTMSGHYSIEAANTVPMEFYAAEPAKATDQTQNT